MDEETLTAETDEETKDDEKSEKGVSSDLIRGHINTIILRSLYDGDKYGYEIIAEIERKSSGQYSLKQPSLYSALKRLEKDGYITSYWGGSVGGGRRKYFSLTDEGKAISEQNQAEWEYSRTIIDSLISDRDFDFSNPAPTQVDMRVLRRSTSRVPAREDDGDDSEEFVFEPSFDDTSIREKLEQEYENKKNELEHIYEEKKNALEQEYAQKIEELDHDRADFEAERARVEESLNAQKEELRRQHDETLSELAALREEQEKALAEAREKQEQELADAREKQEQELADAREKQEQELNAAKEQQEQELKAAREAQSSEEESLKNELELQKKKYDEESAAHEQALANLREANNQALSEQREASEASLRVERELHARNLKELNEAHEKALSDAQSAAGKAQEEAVRAAREEEARTHDLQLQAERSRYETLLSEERARYNTALSEERARHDAQTQDDRRRYEQALSEHDAALRRQMEAEMAEREKQIIHRNFLSLVDSPAERPQTSYIRQPDPAPVEQKPAQEPAEDYRSVVGRLYENSVRPTVRTKEVSSATPVSGIDFRDIQSRAERDGLHVSTVSSDTKKTTPVSASVDLENTVHKGKALFLSALVTFFWALLIGGITMGLKATLAIPNAYPYLMWGIGLVVLLAAILAYANHFGENRLRGKSIALINAIVSYVILVIVAAIVALSVKITFSDPSQLMTYIFLPAIYLIGVLIFGLCYYLQVRPLKKKTK